MIFETLIYYNHPKHFVIPAKAGIQCFLINWTPACTGVTKSEFWCPKIV
jgi:hypothetical protein